MNKYLVFILLVFGFAYAQSGGVSGSERASSQISGALDAFFGAGGASTVTPEQAAAVDDSVLTYQPDEAVSAKVRAQFADFAVQTGAVAPEDKQQLIDGLAQVTLEQQQQFVDSVFVGEDFKADNLADVVAMNVIVAYYTVLGLESTTTEQDLGVRDLFKVVLSGIPEITGMDNAQKQTTTETLMLALLATANDLQQAQAGAAGFDMATVRQNAEQTLLGFGLAPCIFTLGPTGIEAQPGAMTAKTPADLAALCPDLAETIASAEAQGAEVVIPGAVSTGEAATGGAATQTPPDTTPSAQPDITPTVTPITPTQAAGTGGDNPLSQPTNPLAPPTAPDPLRRRVR